jgi:hypothetical protein
VATAEDGGSLLIIFRCAYFMMNFVFELAQVAMRPCKVKDSFVWISNVIINTICYDCYILLCGAISDAGNSTHTVVLSLSKGRTLQNGIRA